MRPTKTLAAFLAGSLLAPSHAFAKAAAAQWQAPKAAAAVSILAMPTLDERRHYLADRVDGWHVMIKEKSELAKDFLPEMAALKSSLLRVKNPEDLRVWGFVVDAFENRLMERLNPELPDLAPKERIAARTAILEQKGLAVFNRAQASADPARRAESRP